MRYGNRSIYMQRAYFHNALQLNTLHATNCNGAPECADTAPQRFNTACKYETLSHLGVQKRFIL